MNEFHPKLGLMLDLTKAMPNECLLLDEDFEKPLYQKDWKKLAGLYVIVDVVCIVQSTNGGLWVTALRLNVDGTYVEGGTKIRFPYIRDASADYETLEVNDRLPTCGQMTVRLDFAPPPKPTGLEGVPKYIQEALENYVSARSNLDMMGNIGSRSAASEAAEQEALARNEFFVIMGSATWPHSAETPKAKPITKRSKKYSIGE